MWMKKVTGWKVRHELQPPALAAHSSWHKLAVRAIVESLLPQRRDLQLYNQTTRFFSIDRLPVSGVYLSSLSIVSYIRHNESRVVCSSSDPTTVPQRHQKRLLTTLPVSQSLEHFPSHRDDYILATA
jgi:hypothetical protein